jgi:hypothetical protein
MTKSFTGPLGRLLASGVTVVVAASLLGACGQPGTPVGTGGRQIETMDPSVLPPDILDLTVTPEDISSSLARVERTYVSQAGFFSMRRDDQVQATVQVLRFNKEARLDQAGFRDTLVGNIGGATPQIGRLGDKQVYFIRGIQQNLSVFFEGQSLVVLSVRDEYEQPRNLLRAVLELPL